MRLHTDDKLILSTAYIVLEKIDQKLYIPIEYNTMHFGELCVYFSEDKENSSTRINSTFSEDKMILEGVNFNSPFGNATITPVSIGAIDSKEIFLLLSSRVLGQDDRRVREITYTLYMENPEDEQE